ncbi:hypothetical protein D9619_005281 [Psilocybe cf. subviscida]|uniref:UDP-galactose transporter n=1 Tax=Psilocybe cf. subviscida TaxID=2480587 RepID=A0A8H5BYU3_9AGAR|nr:hypothetical protein D9619_005281 [Psilocybe cf. subviscida]
MSIHYRSMPTSIVSSRAPTPRHSPLISPKTAPDFPLEKQYYDGGAPPQPQQPTICGMPLKYVSLVTLAVQNAALSIVMHYSRVSIPASLAYSPATAVLMNELLKGSISFMVAFSRSPVLQHPQPNLTRRPPHLRNASPFSSSIDLYWAAMCDLLSAIFSPDCWKLSIPAILYVIQNSLQFVAIANLPVASFQVTYQMKILTTAAFSVALLRKKLGGVKWLSLFFLAIGVGIVQIQSTGTGHSAKQLAASALSAAAAAAGRGANEAVGSAHEYHVHTMNPMKGFGAVTAACFTSGLAGVYFEMVLKGSKADLWVRNVQLSLFSLIPALLPILWATPPPNSRGFLLDLFRHFGGWAWATVLIQVAGGLVTAVVIKYSDNILKGFATSLSIVLSFMASVALFDFHMTPSFIIGASIVLAATWMYNQPAPSAPTVGYSYTNVDSPTSSKASSTLPSANSSPVLKSKEPMFNLTLNDATTHLSLSSSGKMSPTGNGSSGALAQLSVGSFMRRKSGGFGSGSHNSSTASLTALLGNALGSTANLHAGGGGVDPALVESGELLPPPLSASTSNSSSLSNSISLSTLDDGEFAASPFASRPASRMPSRAPSPIPRFFGASS